MILKGVFKKQKPPIIDEPQVETNRLQELKQLKELANTYLTFYVERQKFPRKNWERDLSNRNIALLKATITKLNKLQHDDKIAEYLEATRPTPPLSPDATEEEKKGAFQKQLKNFATASIQGSSIFLLMEINRCSPQLSYFNDLTWFKHGTIREHLDYGVGKVDETVFEKYLPDQIIRIVATKESFFSKQHYQDDIILLEAIVPLIEAGKFIPANILIITLVEGLVRKFACLAYRKQNFGITDEAVDEFAYIANMSLETLIKNRSWKKDIPLSIFEFVNEYAHTDNPTITSVEEKLKNNKLANERIEKKISEYQVIISEHLENPTLSVEEFRALSLKHLDGLKAETANLLTEEDKTIVIGIDVYLDFLAKKFKEDRNNMIHGKYSFFKEKWKTLVYLTALQTLIEKINWYETNVS